MAARVLFVDDDQQILNTFRLTLRRHFDVRTALGPEEALRMVAEEGPFAVVVSDFKMPRMNGIKLLSLIGEGSPNTVRVMLTGYADVDSAIAAINEGHVFRFLTKPCSTELLIRTLEACVEQHRLVTAEKELLRGTLRGSIKILTEILSLVNPEAFGRAERIKRTVTDTVEELGLGAAWKYELAAMLSQIGCVSVPEDILHRKYAGEKLSAEEQQIYDMRISIAVSLLSNIPRMDEVSQIIACQSRGLCPEQSPPLGARLLKLAQDFDDLLQRGLTRDAAAAELSKGRQGYGEEVFLAFERTVLRQEGYELLQVPLSGLAPGMILAQDARTPEGVLVLAKGLELSGYMLGRLTSLSRTRAIQEPVNVLVPRRGAE
ncbi:HD domain-containing phosphohydrolase [Fundidesulfovibrio agrisoli]|uniref:HD domain-containing phosphohydrolase n=1 Tax=Fundidesulfovibrio agrisoli TaxID=2922717 RepID=UPI001FAB7651|nr:HD domain-containing phosphohydrolase [Fundidesulfovibrio agrisoli]